MTAARTTDCRQTAEQTQPGAEVARGSRSRLRSEAIKTRWQTHTSSAEAQAHPACRQEARTRTGTTCQRSTEARAPTNATWPRMRLARAAKKHKQQRRQNRRANMVHMATNTGDAKTMESQPRDVIHPKARAPAAQRTLRRARERAPSEHTNAHATSGSKHRCKHSGTRPPTGSASSCEEAAAAEARRKAQHHERNN